MHRIHLNGADAEAVAEIMGGVLIMVNETDGIATISGGDPAKLNQGAPMGREELEEAIAS